MRYLVNNFALRRRKALVNSGLIGDFVIMKVGRLLSARVRRFPWGNDWDTRFVKERMVMIDRHIVTERILNEL
jgi:hypothetical protein